MILSRRSFLKVAGLSAVAVASASMFTGCGSNFLTTPVKYYPAKDVTDLDDIIKQLNDSSLANSVLGTYSNYDSQKCLNAVKNQLNGTKLLSSIKGLNEVEVVDAHLSSETKDGKTIYFIAAYLKKAEKKTENK